MRRFFIFIALLVLGLSFPSKSMACDCLDLSPSESFAKAEVVFMGEVIREQPSGSETIFTFRVQRLLKGGGPGEISTVSHNTNCDFPLVVGGAYLVYADRYGEHLGVASCSATEGMPATKTAASGTTGLSGFFKYRDIGLVVSVTVVLCLFIWFLPTKFWWRTR